MMFLLCTLPVSYHILSREGGDCGPFQDHLFWLDQLDASVAKTSKGFQELWGFIFSVRCWAVVL